MLPPQRFVKAVARKAVIFISRHPLLKSGMLLVIRRVGLHAVVRTVYARLVVAASGADKSLGSPFPLECSNLSPHARQIYAELKSAIKRSQKERG